MDKIFNINLNGQNYEIQDRPLTEQVATLEGEVAKKSDVYTKEEIDNMVGNINNALNEI